MAPDGPSLMHKAHWALSSTSPHSLVHTPQGSYYAKQEAILTDVESSLTVSTVQYDNVVADFRVLMSPPSGRDSPF
jgi:hypothetical protein